MKNSGRQTSRQAGFIQIIVILLALVLVAAGAYYFGTLKNKISSTNPVVSVQPSASPTVDQTANWKTYVNQIYGFSFKYPNTSTDEPNPVSGSDLAIVFHQFTTFNGTEFWLYVGKQYVFTHSKSDVGTKITVDGFSAIRRDLTQGQNPAQILVEIKHGSDFITLQVVKDASDNTIDQIFSQILSTFKFTNTNKVTTERKFGYIKAITPIGDFYNLSVDLAQFVNDSSKPNNFGIDNPSNALTTIPLSQNPSIVTQTFSHAADGNFNFNQTVNFSDFLARFQSDPNLKTIPFWFDTENGTVTKITEQYIP